ncbi:hypothetical protein [Demequina activiva]|nr:hypothetical protein [Demequina activiva]
MRTWHPGGSVRHTWDSHSWAAACPVDGDIADHALESGEYQVAWTLRVHASQEANAQVALANEGYSVPHSSTLELFREGSYDCMQMMSYDSAVPLTCDPGALFGTEIDLEAGTVTFPYRASAYERDVDATFVSQPQTMTLEGDTGMDWWTQFEESHPPYEPGTPLACGDQIRASSDGVMLAWDVTWDQLVSGSVVAGSAWRWMPDWSTVSVSFPESTRIWLLTSEDVFYEMEDGSQVGTSVDTIAGWVDVDLPAQIEMVRYDGPTELDIALGAVEWCGGSPPARERPPYGVIVDPHQESDGSGTAREVVEAMQVWSDQPW